MIQWFNPFNTCLDFGITCYGFHIIIYTNWKAYISSQKWILRFNKKIHPGPSTSSLSSFFKRLDLFDFAGTQATACMNSKICVFGKFSSDAICSWYSFTTAISQSSLWALLAWAAVPNIACEEIRVTHYTSGSCGIWGEAAAFSFGHALNSG